MFVHDVFRVELDESVLKIMLLNNNFRKKYYYLLKHETLYNLYMELYTHIPEDTEVLLWLSKVNDMFLNDEYYEFVEQIGKRLREKKLKYLS